MLCSFLLSCQMTMISNSDIRRFKLYSSNQHFYCSGVSFFNSFTHKHLLISISIKCYTFLFLYFLQIFNKPFSSVNCKNWWQSFGKFLGWYDFLKVIMWGWLLEVTFFSSFTFSSSTMFTSKLQITLECKLR